MSIVLSTEYTSIIESTIIYCTLDWGTRHWEIYCWKLSFKSPFNSTNNFTTAYMHNLKLNKAVERPTTNTTSWPWLSNHKFNNITQYLQSASMLFSIENWDALSHYNFEFSSQYNAFIDLMYKSIRFLYTRVHTWYVSENIW